jgi:hypothetical protein
MNTAFAPVENLELYCRFCKKVIEFHLERSIAGSGRIVDKQSTFEYFCTKCHHTVCISGQDLLESCGGKTVSDTIPREYLCKERYLIGEVIRHTSLKDKGTIVGKDIGNPSRIIVQFQKLGIKKLVESA